MLTSLEGLHSSLKCSCNWALLDLTQAPIKSSEQVGILGPMCLTQALCLPPSLPPCHDLFSLVALITLLCIIHTLYLPCFSRM
jgi:hypothetical protein